MKTYDERIEELEGRGYVVESGSNENGEYIKFSDGTMICHNQVISCNANSDRASIVFPIQFSIPPTIIMTNRYSNAKNITWSFGNSTKTGFDAFPLQNNAIVTVEAKASYIAIGKWK